MTSKNNRAFLLYHVKLCASFQIHWWIQTGFTVQKRSIGVEIGDMLSRVTLKFDGWPRKTIGHFFYATSSFVHHSVPIGEFKLKLQSRNAQFGPKSTIFLAVWPTNFTDDPQKLCYFKLCASFRTNWWIQIGVTVRVKFDDFESRATLLFDGWPWKTIKAPLLCYFKLCATFRSLWWIQTAVTVRKRPIWVIFRRFLEPCDLEFDGWPGKTIGHLFYATSSFVYHFVPIGEFKLKLQSGNAQFRPKFGPKSTIFLVVWPRNFTDDPQKQYRGISFMLLQALCML